MVIDPAQTIIEAEMLDDKTRLGVAAALILAGVALNYLMGVEERAGPLPAVFKTCWVTEI